MKDDQDKGNAVNPSKQDPKQSDRKHAERGAAEDASAKHQPSDDPQLREIHESAGSDDELGRGTDTPVEQGGARHRQQ
jgi:hypothetical protein